MENKEKIRELQADLRALDADIEMLRATTQKRVAAREGLSAYLEYLQESDKGSDQEPSSPDLKFPDLHAPAHSDEDEEPPATNGHKRKVKIAQEVREAVKETEGDITQKQITRILSEKYPHISISPAVVANSLAKMVERNQGIVLWKRGSGSAPNVYRKVGEMAAQENRPYRVGADEGGHFVEINDAEDSFTSG